MNIRNVVFTGSEIETVIQRSKLSAEVQCQIWSMFVDFAHIDKRFVRVEMPNESDAGDEHPTLF